MVADDDRKDPGDFICSFCGKEAVQIQGMITSGTGTICNECLKDIADIQWEALLEAAHDEQNQDPTFPARRLMKPQVVTRFVSEEPRRTSSNMLGVEWVCDGCGWRLHLQSEAQPPADHSHEILMSNWLYLGVERIPQRKFAKMCNPRWRRLR